ncbi:MAG TPA: hypothetical protein VGQ76_15805 [Thermoanaerobaculia bacterium]|nr:hypothetical protein [Thermoanaerobaculia bacterium]
MFAMIYGLLAVGVFAQVGPAAVIYPAAPTDQDQIRATFSVPGLCLTELSTVIEGSTVRTTVTLFGCVIGPPSFPQNVQAVFGPLSAGTYTYETYLLFAEESDTPELRSQQSLVVAASVPGVPTLAESSRLLLLVLLATVGILTIGRAALR